MRSDPTQSARLAPRTRIRPFDPATDEPGVRACFVALQDHEHDFAPEAPTGLELVDDYVGFMIDRCTAPGGRLFVAVDGVHLVGFASLLVRPRAEPDDTDLAHAEVAELAVLPEARDQGIGTALLAAAEEEARRAGATSLRVRVDARNPGARRLYERLGFSLAVLQLHKRL